MKKTAIFIIMLIFLAYGLTAQENNMVRIEGGTFIMGSPANEPERLSDETQRQITISSFFMGKYEITQKEYEDQEGFFVPLPGNTVTRFSTILTVVSVWRVMLMESNIHRKL